ncbi:hypothetical protein Bwad001_12850 [Bilophila wadsworthia]|uniref:DEAD/DEAH box helicase n=1 Tax=Bilophila wadsworthia TaxID=35833 RepID=UPI0009DCAC8F|nr:SNF2-related protein [Bilophila wadsworthia]
MSSSIPFVNGQKVVDKNHPSDIAVYTGKNRRTGTIMMVQLLFPNGLTKYRPVSQILAVDEETLEDPFDLLEKGRFEGISHLRQCITYEKLKGSLHDIIYSMEAAQIDFYPYQYKPVIKFINSPSERLLLADEVGLGKTIEAILIWLEMQARYQAKRLLIICPKSLSTKWKTELEEKFFIDAKIVNFDELNNEITNTKKYGQRYSFALIGTYTGLRPPKDLQNELRIPLDQKISASPKIQLLREIRFWEEDFYPFDLVIFDEAHYMRNSSTTTFSLGECLSASARGVLCVSATPVNNRNTDLHSLLRLIDEDFFATQYSFDMLLESNRPTVLTGNALGRHPIDKEALFNSLEKMRYTPVVDSPYFKRFLEYIIELEKKHFSDATLISKCQDLIEKMNTLGTYINRTRRVQVQEKRPIRVPRVIDLSYTQEEMALYQVILTAVKAYCAKHNTEFHIFRVMTWQLMAASCLPAFVEKMKQSSIETYGSILTEAFGDDNLVSEHLETFNDFIPNITQLLQYDFIKNDSKFKRLLQLIKTEKNEKIIIFSFYRGTLQYLKKQLSLQGEKVALIHGGVTPEDRWKEIEFFRDKSGARILLSSEVGSEGIDLQFCRIVVNYDLPWNPMRVEQRIGRIDRVGQQADRLSIVSFKIKNTIEERIFTRLHQKLDKFANSLGDLDEVIGYEIKHLTMDLLSNNLTEEEENRRIVQTQKAIEKRQLDIQLLEESGEGLVAFSDYVQKKIEEDRGKGRYIQPVELESYVKNFFERYYYGTIINYNTPYPGCLQISLSDDARESFRKYIDEERTVVSTYLRQKTFTITFNREIIESVRKKNINFINHMSPFIRWITKENVDNAYNTYRVYALQSKTNKITYGTYLFRVEKLKMKGVVDREILKYGLISLSSGMCLPSSESEEVVQDMLRCGIDWTYKEYNKDCLGECYTKLEEFLYTQIDHDIAEFGIENENIVQIKIHRRESLFDRKIAQSKSRLESLIANKRKENVIRMTQATIVKNEEKKKETIKLLNSKRIVDPEFNLVVIGLVNVLQ